MTQWKASIIPGVQESLGDLIGRGVCALRDRDRDAQRRRARRLADAVRRFDGLWRSMGVRDEAQVDEVRQTLLIKLWRVMGRWAAGDACPQDLAGYARQIGVNVARDLLASRGRMRRWRTEMEITDPVVEASGTFTIDELAARAEEERSVEEWSARLRSHLEEYVRAAARTAVRDPARMLGVWYALRVQKRSAEELAAELGVTGAMVWQWARRGAQLIDRIADTDSDEARAEIMRAVAHAG